MGFNRYIVLLEKDKEEELTEVICSNVIIIIMESQWGKERSRMQGCSKVKGGGDNELTVL